MSRSAEVCANLSVTAEEVRREVEKCLRRLTGEQVSQMISPSSDEEAVRSLFGPHEYFTRGTMGCLVNMISCYRYLYRNCVIQRVSARIPDLHRGSREADVGEKAGLSALPQRLSLGAATQTFGRALGLRTFPSVKGGEVTCMAESSPNACRLGAPKAPSQAPQQTQAASLQQSGPSCNNNANTAKRGTKEKSVIHRVASLVKDALVDVYRHFRPPQKESALDSKGSAALMSNGAAVQANKSSEEEKSSQSSASEGGEEESSASDLLDEKQAYDEDLNFSLSLSVNNLISCLNARSSRKFLRQQDMCSISERLHAAICGEVRVRRVRMSITDVLTELHLLVFEDLCRMWGPPEFVLIFMSSGSKTVDRTVVAAFAKHLVEPKKRCGAARRLPTCLRRVFCCASSRRTVPVGLTCGFQRSITWFFYRLLIWIRSGF